MSNLERNYFMCGFAGICPGGDNYIEEITRMCDAITHRGPDHFGYYRDERAGLVLGHRRLSIFDLSENGSQPMFSKDGRYVIVYNGEIYNALDIKKELLESGKVSDFRSTSDTEILLEAIACEGIDVIKKMKGMFAIALFDREEQELTLIRDRAGEKPLHYGIVNGRFVFASDLASIKQIDGFCSEINRDALALYFRLGYIPAPYTIYKDISKLQPGCILKIKAPFTGQPAIRHYWSMKEEMLAGEQNLFEGCFEDASKELEQLLIEVLRGQMLSDVPLGAYLSGGIDSPLVVSLMQTLSSKPVKTFTIGFEDPKFNEAEYAKDIAKYLGTEHTELYVTENELQEVIPMISQIFSEPFADNSLIPTYLVSKLAKEQVTVSLSGDAGDELFCGYNTYYKCEKLWNKINRVPSGLRGVGAAVIAPLKKKGSYYRISECLKADNCAQLHDAVCNRMDYFADHLVLDGSLPANDDMPLLKDCKSSMLYRDICGYHPDDILVKVDRTGMSVSLENRVPMLDADVLKFAFRLPIEYKYENGVSKRILKDILYRHVPEEMLNRPKKGFSVPIKDWMMQGPVSDMANDLLSDSRLLQDGYLDRDSFLTIRKEFQKDGSHSKLLWKLFVAEQWYRGE